MRPTLPCRVFIPTSHVPGSSHPLYINIHGGGFFAGDAPYDDKICHYLCERFNYVVVSLQYRLAPRFPFPVPVDDCTELVAAVLADEDLPIDVDQRRVVVGGQSAGGTLALALAQDPRLRSRISALVVFYAATDFSRVYAGEYRDRPSGPDGKGGQRDGLRGVVPLAEWAYVPYGWDRTDPRLSPVYAEGGNLPRNIYFVAAQYDKLCAEEFEMARRLVGDKDGTEGLGEEGGWRKGGVRWERVVGEVHGFIEAGWNEEFFGRGDGQPWKTEVEGVLGRVDEWLRELWRTT